MAFHSNLRMTKREYFSNLSIKLSGCFIACLAFSFVLDRYDRNNITTRGLSFSFNLSFIKLLFQENARCLETSALTNS